MHLVARRSTAQASAFAEECGLSGRLSSYAERLAPAHRARPQHQWRPGRATHRLAFEERFVGL